MRRTQERAVRCLMDALPRLDPPGKRAEIPFENGRMANEAGEPVELIMFEAGNHNCMNLTYRHRPKSPGWMAVQLRVGRAKRGGGRTRKLVPAARRPLVGLARTGAGPVDPRTTSCGASRTILSGVSSWDMRSRSSSAACVPRSWCGMRTVVSGGLNLSMNGMSLKPTTDTSSGQLSPSRWRAV
jgi:hypothetical protein